MPRSALGAETVVARAPDAVAAPVDGRLVVLDPVGDRYARLNPAAAFLWEQLADPAPLATLAHALADRYGLEGERASADVSHAVSALIERGMAVVVEG